MKHTTHCLYCDKCIEGYDHHCYWINNCVGKNNIDLFFVFLIVIILNILVNAYLDLFCLVNKFEENGFIIIKNSSKDSLYYKTKLRFTRNFFFFDIPNEENKSNFNYDYETNSNPEYLISEDLQGLFSLSRERSINKIKFIRQDKISNSSSIDGNYIIL